MEMCDQSYYLDQETDNVCRKDRGLAINCTGHSVLRHDFTTHMPCGRQDFYLQYLTGGEMDVVTGHRTQVMRPGQAVLYYPHSPYRYSKRGEKAVRYFWVHFTGAEAAELVAGCGLPNETLLEPGIQEPLISAFEGMFREFLLRDSCFEQMAAASLITLCGIIRRLLENDGGQSQGRALSAALGYIHKNYGRQLSVKELAELEHLSVSRFRALFRQRTGSAPLDYLVALRMNQARRLMAQTDLPIREIAELVGYQDQLYFSRMFRNRTGYSPTEYRLMQRL